jgi:hypothetical protein
LGALNVPRTEKSAQEQKQAEHSSARLSLWAAAAPAAFPLLPRPAAVEVKGRIGPGGVEGVLVTFERPLA